MGLQFVLFKRSDAATWEAAIEALRKAKLTVETRESGSAVVKAGPHELSVVLATGASVLGEGKYIADSEGKDRADRAAIASSGARFEVGWESAASGDVVFELMLVTETLEDLTDGVVFDTYTGRFLTEPRT